jgi:hypothetical protein
MGVDGERELEDFLAGSGALNFGDDPEPKPPEPPPPAAEEGEEVVHDEPPGFEPPPGDGAEKPSPETPPEKPVEEQPTEGEGDEQEPHVVWAQKKYGKDPDKWAKAAYDQERFISSLAAEKKQAEETARQAIEYAQQVEASAQVGPSGMPLTASEEAWVEQAMANPVGYAYQAAMSGKVSLYNAVIERVAELDPGMAASVGTQVQMAMHQERARLEAEAQAAASQNGAGPEGDFTTAMGQSFQRLGINVKQYGEAMWTKIEELGEYHPYTLAILGGDPMQRDLAVSAVYDLVRTGQTTTRRVADTEREEQIRREGELRRDAAGVVTGAPHVETSKQSPFFDAMEEEWRRRGQWRDEE